MFRHKEMYVFFEAEDSRYAIDALCVTEVARPDTTGDTLGHHLVLKDLSVLFGGGSEVLPGTAIVFDTSPTLAVRVRSVHGVFDASGDSRLALPPRLIPLVSPAIRGAIVREGHLYFEIDLGGIVRGLPKQTKKKERHLQEPEGQTLVFESGDEVLGIPLLRVKEVVSQSSMFNRSPGRGAFLGAMVHRQQLCTVYGATEFSAPEAFVVLIDTGSGTIGLSARRAVGVVPRHALGDVAIIDVDRMFS